MAISVPAGAKSNRILPIDDIVGGAKKWELWGRLGWLEVKRRYRRTVIGPFWSTISLGIYLTAIGILGAGLWKQNIAEYVPFLAAGMVVWIMFATMLTEAGTLFLSASNLFKHLRFEYSILVYAAVWRNFIVFLHNLIAYVVVILILAPQKITFATLLLAPGLAILLVNALWVTLFFGMLCLRYRDVQQFIMSIIQVLLFVTPIFWPPEALAGSARLVFIKLNPIYHFIELVRRPLLGEAPSGLSYIYALIVTVAGLAFTYAVFARFRRRIAFWG
jgi:ABC-type polysaccharide/polyol phosphate export permease